MREGTLARASRASVRFLGVDMKDHSHKDRRDLDAGGSRRRGLQIMPALNRAHPVHRGNAPSTASNGHALCQQQTNDGPTLRFYGRDAREEPAIARSNRREQWQPLNTGLRPGMLLDVHV